MNRQLLTNWLLGILWLFTTASASAQVGIGVQAGGHSANVRLSTTGTASLVGVESSARTAFHIGAFLDLPLGSKAKLRPQVLYASKGFSTTDETVSLNYLHLPVDVLFTQSAGEGDLFYGIGGYYSTALGGKAGTQQLVFGNGNNADFREADYGLRASLGYQSEFGAGLVLYYEYGLANINPGSTYNLQNRVVGISLQYNFLR